jgi:hypothetical protein
MGISAGITIDLSGQVIETTDTPIKASSIFGTKVIGITPTLTNSGTIDLVGRSSITIQNNGLTAVYTSNANTVSRTTGIYVAAGSNITLAVNPLIPTPIYSISIGVPTSVLVMEV